MHLIRRYFHATATLLLLCVLPAQAQQEERWYQVELLIFSHEGDTSAEQWQPMPALAYPDSGRFLVHPEQVAARQAEHSGASEIDEFGRQILRLPVEEDVDDTATDIPDIAGAAPVADTQEELVAASADTPATALEEPPLTPTPFVALPRNDSEFYGKAAYMQRSGAYRTLFHERWVQPVADEDSALPLILDHSGDIQEWPRLQGSLKIHISRYLHVETNLWLNTHGDYLPGEWRMPAPPLGPPSLIVEEPAPETAPEELYFVTPQSRETVRNALLLEEQAAASEPVYPWRHAVLLQQKRRMRSKETHYIDHPLLGVIIKFTPLDSEALEAMAAAENTPAGSAGAELSSGVDQGLR